MAQTKRQIQSLLSEAGAQPRHRFGQNFMIDGNLVRIVAEAGQIAPDDLVLEVGPGTGTLTEELLATGAQVLAVEIDSGLAELLRTQFATAPNFRLIEGDALAGKHALNTELAVLESIHRTLSPEGSKESASSRISPITSHRRWSWTCLSPVSIHSRSPSRKRSLIACAPTPVPKTTAP